MAENFNEALYKVLHPEPEWKCPICGCTEREPFQPSHYPFGRGRGIIQTFDFSKTASCCKQCRLVFAIPLREG